MIQQWDPLPRTTMKNNSRWFQDKYSHICFSFDSILCILEKPLHALYSNTHSSACGLARPPIITEGIRYVNAPFYFRNVLTTSRPEASLRKSAPWKGEKGKNILFTQRSSTLNRNINQPSWLKQFEMQGNKLLIFIA